jgi:hypothetical protein
MASSCVHAATSVLGEFITPSFLTKDRIQSSSLSSSITTNGLGAEASSARAPRTPSTVAVADIPAQRCTVSGKTPQSEMVGWL